MTKSPGYLLYIGDFKRPTSSYMGNLVTAIVRVTIAAFSIPCKVMSGFCCRCSPFCLETVTIFCLEISEPFSGGFGGHHCWDTLPSSCPMRCENWWDGMLFGWRDGATILGGKAAVRLVFLVNNCHYLPYFLCIHKGWCKKLEVF